MSQNNELLSLSSFLLSLSSTFFYTIIKTRKLPKPKRHSLYQKEGFALTAGMKSSLSAWTALTGGSYQWQICYDDANDLWADILGQTGKGMLISPAMILSIAGENGAAKIRCVVTSGATALTSAAIPVWVAQPLEMRAFALNAGVPEGLAEGDGTDLEKNYVVVQYLYKTVIM